MTISNINDFLKADYSKVYIGSMYWINVSDRTFFDSPIGFTINNALPATNGDFGADFLSGTYSTNFTGGEPITGNPAGFYRRVPDPSPGKNKYFCGLATTYNGGNSSIAMRPCDIIWLASGLPGTTGVLNVNSRPFPARDDSGLASGYGYKFKYLNGGASVGSGAYITYTNTENIPNRTGRALLNRTWFSAGARQGTVDFALEYGDKGIKSIQIFDAGGQTMSPTNGRLMVYRYLGPEACGIHTNKVFSNLTRNGLIEIYSGTCISFFFSTAQQTASIGNPLFFRFVEL